jgi:hypothetical protein
MLSAAMKRDAIAYAGAPLLLGFQMVQQLAHEAIAASRSGEECSWNVWYRFCAWGKSGAEIRMLESCTFGGTLRKEQGEWQNPCVHYMVNEKMTFPDFGLRYRILLVLRMVPRLLAGSPMNVSCLPWIPFQMSVRVLSRKRNCLKRTRRCLTRTTFQTSMRTLPGRGRSCPTRTRRCLTRIVRKLTRDLSFLTIVNWVVDFAWLINLFTNNFWDMSVRAQGRSALEPPKEVGYVLRRNKEHKSGPVHHDNVPNRIMPHGYRMVPRSYVFVKEKLLRDAYGAILFGTGSLNDENMSESSGSDLG